MSDRDDILQAIATLRADVMERIDRLQAHVDAMADAAFVTYAQGEGQQQQVSLLVRQVRRLTARVDAIEEGKGT